MQYLLLSILSSTLIYLIFKIFPKYGIQTPQAIVCNYWVAFVFGCSLITPNQVAQIGDMKWTWLVPIEGVLFITIFNVMALTVQKHGVTVGSVASRTAMIIPAAVFMVLAPEEHISLFKVTGIILACLAVFLSAKQDTKVSIDKRYLYLPFILFFGSGIIDLIIGYAQEHLMHDSSEIALFIPGIFLVAGILGTIALIYRYRVTHDIFWQWKDALGGIFLGLVNYASIYFILRAMDSGILKPEVFFPVNHMGIIAAGTLLGILAFKEKLSLINVTGLILGLTSIYLMTY